ncbi:LOW QUALITY PROTEIN: proliferation marker protein Ki-67 [Sciurus carolinensis]|uniref:LOW QUALITY PROTEIN: proliferation marker protein Ki-67 n=1 Tax=Sciurus carolinensis TaxID=30640 RepID=UPI001FB1D0C9|nr:LOW QUALITY PROTEIN: proliferation marker protein Ki-67 [Sciurus carolinensis]
MRPAGRLVTIKRSGADGAHFPLSLSTCLFGRGTECDIRIQLPVVSKQHCKIEIKEQEAILCNFSSSNPTQVNGSAIQEPVPLKHGDIITIIDRSFRYENESRQNGSKSTESPGTAREQEPARRASRAGFSAEPDGKEQDSKAHSKLTERNAGGNPLESAKKLTGEGSALDGADLEPPSAWSSEHQGHDGGNTGDPSSGDLKAKPRVTVGSGYGSPRSVPSPQSFDNRQGSESPFQKLYQSLKEELDAKPGQNVQCCRKSGSRGGTAGRESAGGLQREPQLSCKPRQKSRRSTLTKEDPPSEPETNQTEKGRAMEPAEASGKLPVSSVPLSKTTREKALVQCPQQPSSAQEHKDEDLHAALGESTCVKAVDEPVTPGKLLTRNQAPTKAEGAANPSKKPENLSSRSRRSAPTNMEALPTEIQSQPFLTQRLPHVERKIQKDSFSRPEKLGTAAGQICSGLPGLSSVDISNFGDSINRSEDLLLKRRRVSFGSRLRPELFDENLPPNTPLKKGETPAKRKSLATHSPAVLKKIIKEQPASPGTELSSAICWEVKTERESTGSLAAGPRETAPGPGDQRRRSGKASAASGGSKSPQDTPKRVGRKSGHLSSKKTSISRSQHGILQMICSKRRSGASEANLIVAKSWADVVKLGAKQTQTRVVKHGPQRQMTRRQRRPTTPKKPTGSVHNQFSTGHANSPCTIIIGKAQIEKVNVPARPYRMLNNLVFNQKMDYDEDLSGLTEMFKTPVKKATTSPGTLSNSENLLGKKSQVPNSGGKPLPITLEILGSSVFSSTQKTAKEPSDKHFASPSLRRQSIRENENTVKTPRNISKVTHFEMRTPDFSPKPLKMGPSASKLRRSVDLRNAQVPRAESKSEAEADAAGTNLGRHPEERRGAPDPPRESTESGEKCGKKTNVRRSRTGGQGSGALANLTDPEKTLEIEPRKDLSGSQPLPQTPACTQQTAEQEEEATNMSCNSPQPEPVNPTASRKRQHRRSLGRAVVQEEASALRTLAHAEPGDDKGSGVFKGTAEQNKDPVAYGSGMKRGPRTPKKKTQPLEDLAGFRELFQTPKHAEQFKTDGKTRVLDKSAQPGPVGTPKSPETQASLLRGKVDVKQERPAREELGEAHAPRGPGAVGRAVKAFEESAQQVLHPAADVTGSRQQAGAAKAKAQPLEDLAGFQELFQTPGRGKDPEIAGETTDTHCKSAEPVSGDTLTPVKRRPRTSLQKVEVKEELSALRKLSQSPGRATHTPTGPAQEEKGIRALTRTPRQKANSAEDLTGLKRQPRTPKEKSQPLEDLAGFQELFQTPGHYKDSKTAGEATDTPCRSAGLEPVRAPASTRRRSKTSVGKLQVKEEASALRELTQMSGKATHTPRVPAGDDEAIRSFEEPVQQALQPAAKVTGSKWQPGAAKEKAQPLEDLAGFQELFQTPGRGKDPEIAGETTDTPCRSAGLEPVRTPASMRRRSKTSVGKVEVKEELSAPRKLSQSPGRATHTPVVPVQYRHIDAIVESPRQKLDLTENLTGLKRQSRTPKEKAQPLEDLAGFQELFQTPDRYKDPKTADGTTEILCKSTEPEPVRALASTRRRSKTDVGKVEVKEELLALRKLSQSPGRATHTPTGPAQEEKGIRALTRIPRQKANSAEDLTGLKRQPRTPKEKSQPLEDLAGFQELFQTPGHYKDSKTAGEATDTPCRSAGLEPVRAPASTRRRSKTSVGKLQVKEEASALRELTQMSGKATHTPRVPAGDDEAIRSFEEPVQQALQPAAKVTGSKWQPGAAKEKAQPLEDLAGFQELFQTPGRGKDPEIAGETTDTPCRSAGLEPVRTPASMRRRSKTSVGKVEVKEELSALRKLSQSPGRATHTPVVPVQYRHIDAIVESPRQKLDLTENLTGLKRQSRTPKEKAQPLEDLAGFQELFQTPGRGTSPDTAGETTDTPCKSAEPVSGDTLTPVKRRPRTSLQKVEVKEELSALRKLSQSPGRATHTPTGPAQEEKGIRALTRTPKQKANSAEDLTGLKRQPRTPKEKSQPLEDLAGFQELFQTPGHYKDSKTAGEATDTPCRSAGLEPVRAPARMRRGSKTDVGKVEVKEELSPRIKLKQTLGETVPIQEESPGGNKGVKIVKPAKRKLDEAEKVTGSKRRRGAPKEKAESLEDLAGFQELFPAPGPTEALTDDKTTEVPCSSPQPEPVDRPASTKRRPRTRTRTAEVQEESPAVRRSARTARATTRMRRAPGGEDQGSGAFEEPAQQTLAPAARAVGSRRLRGAQPLEHLAGSEETIPAPGPPEGPTSEEKTTKITRKPPQPEPMETPAPSKRQLRVRLRKAPVTQELPVQGEVTATSGGPMHTPQEPEGDSKNIKVVKEPVKRKLNPTAGGAGSKRRRGVPEQKTQPREDWAGLTEPVPAPGPTEALTDDEKTTEVPCSSPQPEPVDRPASTKRRPRTRTRTAEVKEESPAVRRPVRTARATTRMRRAPGDEDQSSGAFEEPAQQTLAPAARAAGSRRLRGAPEGRAQPLEHLAGSEETIPAPGPPEGPRNDAHSLKSNLRQTAERSTPLMTSRRLLRAPKAKPVEDKVEVGSRHPAASRGRSRVPLPEGEAGKDGLLSGRGGLCSETAPQDAAQAKAGHGKRRRGSSPEPLVMNKGLKILISRIEPVEEHNSSMGAERKERAEDSAPADTGILLRTRHQKKTEGEQQRTKFTRSATNVKMKRQEKKPMETCQEVEPQNLDDGDEKPSCRGKVRERRVCLRSGRRNQISQPHTAEQEVREKGLAIPTRNQEEKGAATHSDLRCLRSRKPGTQPTLESESDQRVTRGAKRLQKT